MAEAKTRGMTAADRLTSTTEAPADANPSAIAGSPFISARAASSSGASNTHSPVLTRPRVGPTSTIRCPRSASKFIPR